MGRKKKIQEPVLPKTSALKRYETRFADLRPMVDSDLKPGQIVFWWNSLSDHRPEEPMYYAGRVFAPLMAAGYFALMDGKTGVLHVGECHVLA